MLEKKISSADSQNEPPKKRDVFLSILLGKILVKYKDLKHRLANINNNEKYLKIKEDIFEMIDCHTIINEINELSKSVALIEMSPKDFYGFLPFIEQYKSEDSFQNENDESVFTFIETLYPMLTSQSQIELLESDLADRFLWLDIVKFKEFLATINSPYFTLCFIKK